MKKCFWLWLLMLPLLPLQADDFERAQRVLVQVRQGQGDSLVAQFHSFGLRVSLDDFGARYANLSLFASLPFDAVKLDRSLIAGLAGNPINRMLIEDIIQICQTYSMTCIAEGVETSDQIDALMETGCHYAQGYFYDRPMPADLFAQKYLRAVPHRMGN